ncbi:MULTISPECIES: MarR family winged helix-turn-helix transcriptional regulator [Clostridium]|uniref:MarR family winged helix-turn-helix transcriptional regulator n=1 Tax=Clostridium TaxID=1485 RepID=UPI000825A13A|nr:MULTISPECIES: MarR family transcriptional regulator [Clostridium]PJI07396.1 MarR family transcriptional regulator [Clostridium sp. CT7]
MDKKQSEKLVLGIVNFYILFENEILDLMPDFNNSEVSPLLSKMLNEIHIQGRTTSSELSERLNISIPNTSRSVNALYKLGYITKKQDSDDKRIIYLALSRKGVDLISSCINISQEKFLERFKVLSDKDIKQLMDSFSTINGILIKMRELNKND